MSTLKVAVSGLRQGLNHLKTFRTLIPETEVIGVYDTNLEKGREIAAEYEVPRVYETFESLLADDDVDILVVAAPCPYHGPQTLAGLQNGKHVVVEVGVDGFSLDRLWEIVKAAEFGGLKVQVGNHHRWDPRNAAMKKLITDGALGELFYGEAEYLHDLSFLMQEEPDGTAMWRNGFGKLPQPGISSGGGIHAIDTIRWLFGQEFVEVTGFGNRISHPFRDVDDLEVALFRTATGAIAKVTVSKGVKRAMSTYYGVYGTGGSAERDRHGNDSHIYVSGDPGVVATHARMEKVEVTKATVSDDIAKLIGHGGLTLLQDRDLVEAILDDKQPKLNVYEGARSSAAGICAWQAIREGRSVKIPSFPDRSEDYKRFKTKWGWRGTRHADPRFTGAASNGAPTNGAAKTLVTQA